MSERDRLRALLAAGRTAAAGVRALLTGLDVVIDPNADPDGPAPAPAGPSGGRQADAATPSGTPAGSGSSGTSQYGAAGPSGASLSDAGSSGARPAAAVGSPGATVAPPVAGSPGATAAPRMVGSPIGRRALAAAAHRPGLAERVPAATVPEVRVQPGLAPAGSSPTAGQGAAPASTAGPPLTLACYPCDGAAVLCRKLGIAGEMLPAHGDLEGPATARDLAWLPILAGWSHYRSLPGGRLVAVGGYRRAALVRFGPADGGGAEDEAADGPNREAAGDPENPSRGRYSGIVWAALGNDALAAAPPVSGRLPLCLEEPERLRATIAAGQVGQALLGGADLAWAEGLPTCREVHILSGADVGLDWTPVWGLFSRAAAVPWPGDLPDADPHIVLAPLDAAPALMTWLNRVVVT